LQPELSLDESEKRFKGRYLSRADYTFRFTENTWGKFADGKTAFIYLQGVIPQSTFNWANWSLLNLKFNDVKNSRRAGLKRSKGGELVLGYINFPEPRKMASNSKQWLQYIRLFPLLNFMSSVIRQLLPEYHEQQLAIAAQQPDQLPWLDFLSPSPEKAKGVKEWLANPEKRKEFPIFSTMTINKSTLFRAHADAKNEGGLACLTAFGHWSGGEFCLPRLRVAFPLTPGSILIADNNKEQHGNIGPLVGNRISVVAYLRAMNKKAAPKAKAASAGKS